MAARVGRGKLLLSGTVKGGRLRRLPVRRRKWGYIRGMAMMSGELDVFAQEGRGKGDAAAQQNGIDWLNWGGEASEIARMTQRPILLYIGYSGSFWCQRLSSVFSKSESRLTEILRNHFVCVLVERDERPDLSNFYSNYLHCLHGHSGWPMVVCLTPEFEPFIGGCYSPVGSTGSLNDLQYLLEDVVSAWDSSSEKICSEASNYMLEYRDTVLAYKPKRKELDVNFVKESQKKCFRSIERSFDPYFGGFGESPKYPFSMSLHFLLVWHFKQSRGDDLLFKAGKTLEPGHMVSKSLDGILKAGIHDHVGGGFHQYSIDMIWHVPDFEKTLYDNAQLAACFTDAYLNFGKSDYVRGAMSALDYMSRTLLSESGGFLAGEGSISTACSLGATPSEEPFDGQYYTWQQTEVRALLSEETNMTMEQIQMFCDYYCIKVDGNCTESLESDSWGYLRGRNVLRETMSKEQEVEEIDEGTLSLGRKALLDARIRRPAPVLNRKVISGWNGLAISAFARASRSLDDTKYLDIAVASASHMKGQLWNNESRCLLHLEHIEDEGNVYAIDYACMIAGALDLFEATGDTQWLLWAIQMQDAMVDFFWHDESGGGFLDTLEDQCLRVPQKADFETNVPAASSLGAENMLRIAAMLPQGDKKADLCSRALTCVLAFEKTMKGYTTAAIMPTLCTLSWSLVSKNNGYVQVLVVGDFGSASMEAMLNAAHKVWVPNRTIIPIERSQKNELDWRRLNPNLCNVVAEHASESVALALICIDFQVIEKVTDPLKLKDSVVNIVDARLLLT